MVAALVHHGLVDADRAEQARTVVAATLDGTRAAQTSLRRRLAEVAGYVGGALVVAAAAVFLAEEWNGLSTGGRAGTLALIALVLFGAAVSVLLLGGRGATLAAADEGVRRRLASALSSGGAVAAAFTVGVLVEAASEPFSSAPWAAGGLALVVAGLGAYLLAPSALGQLVMAAGAVQAVVSGLDTFVQPADEVPLALLLLGLGVAWLVLTRLGAWWEPAVGLVVGCALLLFGAQFPTLGSDEAWVGYLLTFAVAVCAVVLYMRTRAVPYLVTAVAGITLAVPEALLDWTDGSLGPVGVLLATGVTLLAASLLGLRLRQEVGAPAQPGGAG